MRRQFIDQPIAFNGDNSNPPISAGTNNLNMPASARSEPVGPSLRFFRFPPAHRLISTPPQNCRYPHSNSYHLSRSIPSKGPFKTPIRLADRGLPNMARAIRAVKFCRKGCAAKLQQNLPTLAIYTRPPISRKGNDVFRVSVASGRSTTHAFTASPHFSSGTPITATSAMSGCENSAFSTSAG